MTGQDYCPSHSHCPSHGHCQDDCPSHGWSWLVKATVQGKVLLSKSRLLSKSWVFVNGKLSKDYSSKAKLLVNGKSSKQGYCLSHGCCPSQWQVVGVKADAPQWQVVQPRTVACQWQVKCMATCPSC